MQTIGAGTYILSREHVKYGGFPHFPLLLPMPLILFSFLGGGMEEREERLIKSFSYILHADQEWASLENTTEINNAQLICLQQQRTETDEKQNQDTLPS